MPLGSLLTDKNNLFSQGYGLGATLNPTGSSNSVVYGPPAPNFPATSSATTGANATSATTGQPIYVPPPTVSQPKTTTPTYAPRTSAPSQPGSQQMAQQMEADAQTAADAAAAEARAQQARLQSRFETGVNAAYQPIFDALDRQIGMEQAELTAANTEGIQAGTREAQVSDQYGVDLAGMGTVRDTATSGLNSLMGTAQGNLAQAQAGLQTQADTARLRAQNQTKTNLRDIDEATRNLTRSGLRRLGAAGDSSSAIAIQSALSRENLKSRGRALGIRDEVLGSIDEALIGGMGNLSQQFNTIKFGIQEKMNEVQNVYAQNKSQLDSWKTQQLNNLVNVAQERINQLELQKANVSQQKQSEILNMQIQTEQQLIARLQQLDDEVRNINTSLDQWALTRAANLEDYQRQLASAAQYGGSTSVSTPNIEWRNVPAVAGYNADGTPNIQTFSTPTWVDSNGNLQSGEPLGLSALQGQLMPAQEEEQQETFWQKINPFD